jgi:hypothetical protein
VVGRISYLGMLYPDHVYSAYVYTPDRRYPGWAPAVRSLRVSAARAASAPTGG